MSMSMRDIFSLPVDAIEIREPLPDCLNSDGMWCSRIEEHIALAINSHDELVDELDYVLCVADEVLSDDDKDRIWSVLNAAKGE